MTAPLELYLLTFNCARILIDPALLGPSLFDAWPTTSSTVPDVVAFSLQEVAPIAYSFLGPGWIEPYIQRVEESLHVASAARLKNDENVYERVALNSVGMTAAVVFVKKDVSARVKSIQKAGVGVGVWEMGNKGGVGIRFSIDGTSLTFVAMHLAPMEGCVLRRNKDWEDICRGLLFEEPDGTSNTSTSPGTETEPLLANPKRTPTGLYEPNNHIFLFGDLNYRTSHLPPTPSAYKTFPQPSRPSDSPGPQIPLPDLLARDQLNHERLQGRVLHGFTEQPITFPPTYKYSHVRASVPAPQPAKSDRLAENEVVIQEPQQWTWAHHRWPSWCDRILFYPPAGLTPGTYTALPLQPSSDHRPVALHVTLHPGTPLAAEDIGTDLRRSPPFSSDPTWRERRAAARRYEVVVGIAGWITLTTEGNAVLAGLLGGLFAIYFLLRVFGTGL